MAPSRVVGVVGATGIGVGSMLGAGVFVVWGPAIDRAGSLIVAAALVAGAVALVNALSSAQLAARYPTAGGAYTYGRAELGPTWGLAAGLAFVVGKTASVAAVALAIGSYTWAGRAPIVASALIVASWALNASGVRRTAAAATAIGATVVVALAWILLRLATLGPVADPIAPLMSEPAGWPAPSPLGFLSGAALIFFAFAGYARIATLGGEVRRPERTIPCAILAALAIVVTLYVATAWVLRHGWADIPAGADLPLLDLADRIEGGDLTLAIVAPLAAAGALIALMAGVGRTAMAMAGEGDLPGVLARVNRTGVPWLAEGASASLAVALAWRGDLGFAIAVSSCAVLAYYAIANLAAARQRRSGRAGAVGLPALVSIVGASACAALAISLPREAVATVGVGLGAIAIATWAWRRRWGIAPRS